MSQEHSEFVHHCKLWWTDWLDWWALRVLELEFLDFELHFGWESWTLPCKLPKHLDCEVVGQEYPEQCLNVRNSSWVRRATCRGNHIVLASFLSVWYIENWIFLVSTNYEIQLSFKTNLRQRDYEQNLQNVLGMTPYSNLKNIRLKDIELKREIFGWANKRRLQLSLFVDKRANRGYIRRCK
jgi:hypothetical protein